MGLAEAVARTHRAGTYCGNNPILASLVHGSDHGGRGTRTPPQSARRSRSRGCRSAGARGE
jgi:hypothetical protein